MIASTSDSGVQLAVKTTFCQHPGVAASNKRLYLVATTRKLREVLTRAAHASGCEVVTLKRFDDLEQAGLAEVGVLVVEAAALQSEEQREHLRRLSSTHNTLVFNERFDSTVVELLRGELCNHAVHTEQLSLHTLIVTMTKLLTGDIFGVDKYLPWGVPIQAVEIGSYEQKRAATDLITDYLRHLGCRRPLVAHIELAVEELLINALYDAPSEEGGGGALRQQLVQELTSGGLAEQPVTVRFASSGDVFLLSVTDVYGMLSKGTVVERLRGNLDQIGMESGAGLYVLLSRAAQVIVNVAPAACTEVISFFDLQWPIAQPGVRAFHYFEEPGSEG